MVPEPAIELIVGGFTYPIASTPLTAPRGASTPTTPTGSSPVDPLAEKAKPRRVPINLSENAPSAINTSADERATVHA